MSLVHFGLDAGSSQSCVEFVVNLLQLLVEVLLGYASVEVLL